MKSCIFTADDDPEIGSIKISSFIDIYSTCKGSNTEHDRANPGDCKFEQGRQGCTWKPLAPLSTVLSTSAPMFASEVGENAELKRCLGKSVDCVDQQPVVNLGGVLRSILNIPITRV